MKKILTSGLVVSAVLLAFAYASLLLLPKLFPRVAEEYYNPAFVNDASRNFLYYVHAVVLAFALSWFWNRFKTVLTGNSLMRGIELALVYFVIATFPAMLMLYSTIDVSLLAISTFLLYGFAQALMAGVIFSKMDK